MAMKRMEGQASMVRREMGVLLVRTTSASAMRAIISSSSVRLVRSYTVSSPSFSSSPQLRSPGFSV